MRKKGPEVVVLGALDKNGNEMGIISVTADSHFGVDFQAGKFEAALKNLREIYEVIDDPEIVGNAIDFLRNNEWEFIENASVLYDADSQTEVRRVVRLKRGALASETVGFLSYSKGQVSGIKLRLEDAVPIAAKERSWQDNDSDSPSPVPSADASKSRNRGLR